MRTRPELIAALIVTGWTRVTDDANRTRLTEALRMAYEDGKREGERVALRLILCEVFGPDTRVEGKKAPVRVAKPAKKPRRTRGRH